MGGYNAFSATEIGGGHIKHGKECQDVSFSQDVFYSLFDKIQKNAPLALALAADGHGADECFRSARGAEIAVGCAKSAITEFCDAHKGRFTLLSSISKPPEQGEFEGLLRDLVKHIVGRWHITVEEDIKQNPFTEEELAAAGEKYRADYEAGKNISKAYGSTLIACAATKWYWFGFHIGDGRLTALYKDGCFDQPVPWDNRCFLNQTTSICDEDAADNARFYFMFHSQKAPPAAVFLCSDGVDDNYPVENNETHLFKLYRTIALTFVEDGFESTCVQLKDLARSFATKGKGDDTSIAGIIDMEKAKAAAGIWREQIAAEEKGNVQ